MTPVVYCNHINPSKVRIAPVNLLVLFFSVKIWCSYPRTLSVRKTPLRLSATVCSVCCHLHFMLCASHERVELKQQTTLQYVINEYPSCTEAFSSSADYVTAKDSRLRLKCDGTRADTRFRLSAKRTSPFKSAGVSVQSTTGNRGVRIRGSNAGYSMFRGSVTGTGYPLHSPVSPSLPLPCVTVCHHFSTGR
jgi:hypothetical protein